MQRTITIFYPHQCQSGQCGATECVGCRHEQVQNDFKAIQAAGARQPDPIWSPAVYEITTSDKAIIEKARHFMVR